MQLSPNDIDRIEAMLHHMTFKEIAEEFGVSHDLMRKTASMYGITDPKLEAKREQNNLIKRWWLRNEPTAIATYLDISLDALRMRVKRLQLPTSNQTRLPL